MAWFVQMDSSNKGSENEAYLSPKIELIPEEQARFNEIGEAFGKKLNQDWLAMGKKPWETQHMPEEPYLPYFSPAPIPSPSEGWRWPMPDRPFRDRLSRMYQSGLVDILGSGFRAYAISQKMIDIIESIEPGVHQYLPYELLQPDGSVHPDRRWLLNCCTRVQAIDWEKSRVVKWQNLPFYGDLFTETERVAHIVVRKEVSQGRALWYDYLYRGVRGGGAAFTLSNALWDALNDAGCQGWRPVDMQAFRRGIEEV